MVCYGYWRWEMHTCVLYGKMPPLCLARSGQIGFVQQVRSCPMAEEDASGTTRLNASRSGFNWEGRRRRSNKSGHLPPIDAYLQVRGQVVGLHHWNFRVLFVAFWGLTIGNRCCTLWNFGHVTGRPGRTQKFRVFHGLSLGLQGSVTGDSSASKMQFKCQLPYMANYGHICSIGWCDQHPLILYPMFFFYIFDAEEHAVIPVYSDTDDLGDNFASPTKQYIYACQREQAGTWLCHFLLMTRPSLQPGSSSAYQLRHGPLQKGGCWWQGYQPGVFGRTWSMEQETSWTFTAGRLCSWPWKCVGFIWILVGCKSWKITWVGQRFIISPYFFVEKSFSAKLCQTAS